MAHIINLFTVMILLVNLAGIALFAQQWIRAYPLAKVITIIGGCLLLFFIEHFIGLGKIAWIWPLSTFVCGYFICTRGRIGWEFLIKNELPFLVLFFIVFIWRYCFPDIDNRAEGLADLAQSSSFSSGAKLPPPDYWLSQYPVDIYYTFQPYTTALLGRVLGVTAGVAYNLSVCVILALFGSLVFYSARRFCGLKTSWFITIAATFGGTAVSMLTHFIKNWDQGDVLGPLWAGIRFIGRYDTGIDTPFGLWLFPASTVSTQDLPLETPGFLMMLGDNHAPLGGFLILAMTIAIMIFLEKEKDNFSRALPVMIGASVALSLVTNTWIFPLQALLVLGWWIYNWSDKKMLNLSLGGLLLGFMLITPFLQYFAPQAVNTPIKLVEWADHTPLRKFIALFWPLLFLIGFTFAKFKPRTLAFSFAVVGLIILLVSEFFYMDDRGGGEYTRFNTTLKWWSWLQVLLLVGLLPRVLASGSTAVRVACYVILFAFSTFTIDLARQLILAPKVSFGKLHGHYWVSQDEQIRALLNFLVDQPKGVTLEYPYQAAYSKQGAISLFADKPTFLGWPGHEALWRNSAWFIDNRSNQIVQFYQGKMPNAADWLKQNNIQYVIWDGKSNPSIAANFDTINGQIIGDYQWQWFDVGAPIGVWVRR